MATLAQIILLIACACLVDCRFLRRFHKHLPDDHHQTAVKTNFRDADAVIFPNDSDPNLYIDDSKKITEAVNVMIPNTHGNDEGIAKGNVEDIVMPLISKISPVVEDKDVFTNPVSEKTEIVTDKNIDDTTTLNMEPGKLVEDDAVTKNEIVRNENQDAVTDDEGLAVKVNDTSNLNDTVPDFSSRFGGTGNYMLVPVATNVQNIQPIQANPNIIPISNVQGTAPIQTYLPTNDQNPNNQQLVSNAPNVATSVHYTTPNSAPNIGTNTLQVPANVAPNLASLQYPANNVNYIASQGNTNTYVNVPNTYVINGQLYAAVTVPNNANVPNTLYYVNPQVSGYQVANNMPLYKLVSVNNGGNQVLLNTQYVQSK